MKDYYELLGIKKDSSLEEIKRACIIKAKMYHHDNGGNKEKYNEIVEAYGILSNAEKRANYDNLLDNIEKSEVDSILSLEDFLDSLKSVCEVKLYIVETGAEDTVRIKLDPETFPKDKYCSDGYYYGFKISVSGEEKTVICTKNDWLITKNKLRTDNNKYEDNNSQKANRDKSAVFSIVLCILLFSIIIGFVVYFNNYDDEYAFEDESDISYKTTSNEEETIPSNIIDAPENGTMFGYIAEGEEHPEIFLRTPSSNHFPYYFVTFIDVNNPSGNTVSVFVHRGKNQTFKLRDGQYDIKYAGGKYWIGDGFYDDYCFTRRVDLNDGYKYTIVLKDSGKGISSGVTSEKNPWYGLVEENKPRHGTVKYTAGESEKNAPFDITLPKSDNLYYYIKLVNKSNGSVAQSVFMHPGTTIEINVPLGVYELRYACGDKWYGYENTFGPNGGYSKSDDKMEFTYSNGVRYGMEVTLYPVINGNMKTEDIDYEDF